MLKVYSGLLLCSLLFCCKKNPGNPPRVQTDSFIVTVNNGYGGGTFNAGDTVHIFSPHYRADELFDRWSGDVSLLDAPDEWHTWFIMPHKNVTLSGSIKTIKPFTLQFEEIKGRDRLKPVYYYLTGQNKGVVYLLHGTGGTASFLVSDYEFQQLINTLVDDNFGIIVTECEESTTRIDENGDGKIRWKILPMDTTLNVDYANIRVISDTFYHRSLMIRTQPRYSIGMSDGGYFSTALSYMYNFKAGVNYCAQGSPGIIDITNVPTQFCMAANDENPNIGAAGNAEAFDFSKELNARGVCSKYLIRQRYPFYPQIFARSGELSDAQSVAVLNELRVKGYIDDRNYFKDVPENFLEKYKGDPATFPVINALFLPQKLFVIEQIKLCFSDHHMYSDFDKATLRFLNSQCQ